MSSYEIEALVGLVSLKSQGHGCGPHPIVGEAVCLSRQAVSRRWVTVPVVTAWRCCLVHAAWHRDGVCLD
jgi:hypothetical protein